MKKVLIFDQDDTINSGSKQEIDKEVAELFVKLLGIYEIVIVTGAGWDVVKKVDIDALPNCSNDKLVHYHIMPNTGTQYWRFNLKNNDWVRKYANFFTDEEAEKITSVLERAAKKLGYWAEIDDNDQIIENRGSQITYSGLGQWADVAAKKAWDPDHTKRIAILNEVKPAISELGFNISYAGATSIDVTMPGIDKAYAVKQLMDANGFTMEECLFVGDMLKPGGNDYPVLEMGVDCIAVKDCKDTRIVLKEILELFENRKINIEKSDVENIKAKLES